MIELAALDRLKTDEEKWRFLASNYQNFWDEFHKQYPDQPCPFKGGFEKSMDRLLKKRFGD